MKVLVVGDTHGNLKWWTKRVLPTARERGISTIVQVGDWGYWEHTRAGLIYLHRLNDALQYDLTLYWLDGNHENHNLLRSVYLSDKSKRTQMVFIRDRIVHLPRGCSWTWEGVKMMACGGAFSVDKEVRTPGLSWWPEETTTPLDVRTCRAVGKVDVLFTHDAPTGAPVASTLSYAGGHVYPETEINRGLIRNVMDNARPKLLMHGHWHYYYDVTMTRQYGDVRVVGLDCDTSDHNSMAVLTLPGLEVEVVP